MVDPHARLRTIKQVGREDRATLRSDPSARTDAGMHNGAFQAGTPHLLNVHIGHKAINLGASNNAPNNVISPYRSSICADLQGSTGGCAT